jgi:hypothetical protein
MNLQAVTMVRNEADIGHVPGRGVAEAEQVAREARYPIGP